MRFLFVLLGLSVCVFGFTQKSYTVNYKENIVIDGDLSDWEGIPFTDEFVDHELGTITSDVQSTLAKIAWDSYNLYVAFLAEDWDITATEGAQDAAIFNTDDLIEIFIDADGNGIDYIEIGVNARDVYYDYVLECVSVSCGGWMDNQGFDLIGFDNQSSFKGTLNYVSDRDTSYTVEMKIPFDALTLIPNGGFTAPESGDVWKANLFRVDPNVWHGTEYLSWSSHDSFGFHQPSKFGDLVFEGGPLTGFDNMSEDYVQLYPNPSSGSVLFSKKVSSVEVFNVLGENVYSDENIENVDLSYLEKGVYVFSLFVEGRTITSKLVIK